MSDKFVQFVKQKAQQHEVKVILAETPTIHYAPGIEVHGYFDDQALELACAMGVDYWLRILVHEFSHMEQWIEQCSAWTEGYIIEDGQLVDANTILDKWLMGHRELTPDELRDCITRVRNVELDCEKRVVENIRMYNLPIDIPLYIKKANTYIYFYQAVAKHRKWYKGDSPPYENQAIVCQMADHFNNNYDIIPIEVEPLFDQVILGVI